MHVYARGYSSYFEMFNTIIQLYHCNSILLLFLKVMLAKNLEVQKGLVNGARGVVIDFEVGVQGDDLFRYACLQSLNLTF